MKKRLGCLWILITALIVSYAAYWHLTKALDDYGDDFLNAVYAGNLTMVDAMLKEGESPNKFTSYGNNPMTLAAYAGHADVLKLLLIRGGRVNIRDSGEMTPLHCAAYYNHVDAGQVLLDAGAELNATNHYGFTPLSESVANGYPEMTELLLRAGASVTNRDNRGWQPLHQALRSNEMTAKTRMQIVTLLLDNGADPNAANPGGWEEDYKYDSTISPFAAFEKRNPNRGNTPLQIAESNGFQEIAELLIKHGAK